MCAGPLRGPGFAPYAALPSTRWGWIAASRRGFGSWKRELTGLGRVPFRGGVRDEEGLLPAHLGGRPARIRRQITASACLVGRSVRSEVPGSRLYEQTSTLSSNSRPIVTRRRIDASRSASRALRSAAVSLGFGGGGGGRSCPGMLVLRIRRRRAPLWRRRPVWLGLCETRRIITPGAARIVIAYPERSASPAIRAAHRR
jgi:hypothetical protein